MTNEQEVIEYLKQFSKLMKKWDATEISSNMDTVLSLIKEQDKYIKDANDITTEMSNDIKKLTSEIKKKDKQIDLMAEEIIMTKPANCTRTNEFNTEKVYMSKEEIKQYFADLVEKEN